MNSPLNCAPHSGREREQSERRGWDKAPRYERMLLLELIFCERAREDSNLRPSA